VECVNPFFLTQNVGTCLLFDSPKGGPRFGFPGRFLKTFLAGGFLFRCYNGETSVVVLSRNFMK